VAPEQPPATYTDMVMPMVTRLELAAALEMEFVHKPEGARSLAQVLRRMAAELDLPARPSR
jgi:2-keto-3-deoxy-L-rhamnonate aldolase RhmA